MAVSLLFSQIAGAAGFQSQEQSAAVLGVANAGTAVTRDASIAFFNPAGLTQFEHPVVSISGIWVDPDFRYHVLEATDFVGNPIIGNMPEAGKGELAPSAFYIHPINSYWAVALALVVPFGLSTNYGKRSLARYFATKSKTEVINISPSIAYKINDKFSIGGGVDVQRFEAELNQAVDFASLSMFNQGDVYLRNKAHDWSVGWNLGLFFQVSPQARLGLAYRSGISHTLKGDSRVCNVPSNFIGELQAQAFGLRDSDISAKVQLPDMLTLSFLYDITPDWTTMADIQYVRWSRLKSITLNFFGNPTNLNPATNHLDPTTLVLDYKDTVRAALGQEYKANKHVKLRAGIAYDQTPARGAAQLIRLPDGDRYWLALGAGFNWHQWSLDLAYAHIFIEDRTVSQSVATSLGGTEIFSAKYKASNANLFGAQLSYQFA